MHVTGAGHSLRPRQITGLPIAMNHHGGPAACPNDARLSRIKLQRELLAGVERVMLGDEAVAEAGRRFARQMREQRTP